MCKFAARLNLADLGKTLTPLGKQMRDGKLQRSAILDFGKLQMVAKITQ